MLDQLVSKGKKKKKKKKKKLGVTEFVLEMKRITDHSISRSFSHLGIHYYQQRFK